MRANTSSTKYYLVDQNNHTGYPQVLEELNTVGGLPTVSYVLADDVIGQCGTTTTDPRWLLHDGHGSTRVLADHSAAVTSHYGYEAYGSVQIGSSSTADAAPTTMLYCGQQYDSTLKMYNLRARFYDPSNGRLNAMDSFEGYTEDPQSLHKYLYTDCDPVNAIDPSGHDELVEVEATEEIGEDIDTAQDAAIARRAGKNVASRIRWLWDVSYGADEPFHQHEFIWAQNVKTQKGYGYHVVAAEEMMILSRDTKTAQPGLFVIIPQNDPGRVLSWFAPVASKFFVAPLSKKQFIVWNVLAAGEGAWESLESLVAFPMQARRLIMNWEKRIA